MNNLVLHRAVHGTTQLTSGTEKFNAVFQQYPLQMLVSSSRRAKYINKKDLQKHNKFVDRPVTKGPGKIPKDMPNAKWVELSSFKFRLYNDGQPVIVNRIQKLIDNGDCNWFPKQVIKHGKKETEYFLGYCYPEDANYIDKTKGNDGFVLANPKAAGTERWERINGQRIWDGSIADHSRNKLKEFLTAWFTPRITQQLPDGIWAPKGSFIHVEFIFYFPFAVIDKAQDIDNHAYPYVKAFMDTLVTLQVIKGDDPKTIRGTYAHYIEVASEEERRMEVKFHFCTNDQVIIPKIFVNDSPTLGLYDKDPL